MDTNSPPDLELPDPIPSISVFVTHWCNHILVISKRIYYFTFAQRMAVLLLEYYLITGRNYKMLEHQLSKEQA